MMMYTRKASVLIKAVSRYVRIIDDSEYVPHEVSIYIQNVTTHCDFYILARTEDSTLIFSLVDALPDPYVLDLEWADLIEMDGDDIYYKIYPLRQRPTLEEIRQYLIPIKAQGIPSKH